MTDFDPTLHPRGGNPTNTGEYSAKANSAPGDVLTAPEPQPIDLISYATEHILVELEDIGEGLNGDYDESDPDDVPLLRVSVFQNLRVGSIDGADWDNIDGASWCTKLPVTSDREQVSAWLKRAAEAIEAHADNPSEMERAAHLVADEAQSLSPKTVATAAPLGDAPAIQDGFGQQIRDHLRAVPEGIEPEEYAQWEGNMFVDEVAARDHWNSTRWERFYDAWDELELGDD